MNTIDPEKFYTINSIVEQRLFPKGLPISYPAIKRYVQYDIEHDNILKAVVKPAHVPSGTRYFIKGENIIKFLAKFEDGSLFLNYPDRSKQNARRSQSIKSDSGRTGDTGPTSPAGSGEEPEKL